MMVVFILLLYLEEDIIKQLFKYFTAQVLAATMIQHFCQRLNIPTPSQVRQKQQTLMTLVPQFP